MKKIYESCGPEQVTLLDSEIKERFRKNEELLLYYQVRPLMRNFYFEAGLWHCNSDFPPLDYWGWEGPTSDLRGHYLGHWLSAAAISNGTEKNRELIDRAYKILDELERCQEENGGEWLGSIPEKQLKWTARGKQFGVPFYTVHKTIMGLVDMYVYAGAEKALKLVSRFADWFYRWTESFSDEQMDRIMEIETGGMLEEWCRLYEITGEEKYKILMQKFLRRPLLRAMLEKKDVLSNHHANTTVPEMLGIAKMYEVTGDEQYLEAVKNYWELAVEYRGTYVTGGQTSGEVWIPPKRLRERMGKLTQEHCVVYNMMRLAEFLFTHTGDVKYEDYRELNLYNGVLAQQNPQNGHAAYYLPIMAGAKKIWATKEHSFWCCCGSGIQAAASHGMGIYAENEETVVINQFIPSEFISDKWGRTVKVRQERLTQACSLNRLLEEELDSPFYPMTERISLEIDAAKAEQMELRIRVPFWCQGIPQVLQCTEQDNKNVNQVAEDRQSGIIECRKEEGFSEIDAEMKQGYLILPCGGARRKLQIIFTKVLTVQEMPDCPEMIAFREGPVVLAGLTKRDRLRGDRSRPEEMLKKSNERQWWSWMPEYRTVLEEENIEFKPLYQVEDEEFTIYFYNERKQ